MGKIDMELDIVNNKKVAREEDLEYTPDSYYWERLNYANSDIKINETLEKSKYIILGGYVSPIFYGDTSSIYGNASCLGNAFCGLLVYDLNGNGKGFDNVYYLDRHDYPFKGGVTNDILSYIGQTFEINGNEVDEYGYIKVDKVHFEKQTPSQRLKNLYNIIKSFDINSRERAKLVENLIQNIEVSYKDELAKKMKGAKQIKDVTYNQVKELFNAKDFDKFVEKYFYIDSKIVKENKAKEDSMAM